MKHLFENAPLCRSLLAMAALIIPQTTPQVGRSDPGAPTLSAYLVEGKPCIPVKRFSYESGYQTSVSPNGRHIAIIIGMKTAAVYDGQRASVDNKELALSVKPVQMDGDVYLPLEFFEQAYPVKINYNAAAKLISVQFAAKSFKIPVQKLPKK